MLSNIEELLERSVFHLLRELVVAEGYLPNIRDYDIENTNLTIATTEQTRYDNQIISIAQSMGFVIDIFGSSNNQVKDFKKAPRIVIDTVSFQPGSLGGDTTPIYVLTNGVYVKNNNPSLTSDFYYNIYVVAENIKQLRTLTAIVSAALPRRGYIKTYIDNTLQHSGNLFNYFVGSGDTSDAAEGLFEKYFNYTIPDIFETLPKVIDTTVGGKEFDIVPINDIQLETLSTIININ